MRILITGGSGFIGVPIIEKLLKSDKHHHILAVTRKIKENLPVKENISWVECNLSDLSSLTPVLKKFNPEIIIHLAWQDIPDFSSSSSFNNLKISIDFFQTIWALESCQKILVAGSCFEYNRNLGICTETDVTLAKDFFTWAKLSLLNYLLLECQQREIDLAWFRLFYVYGHRQRADSLLPTLIKNIKRNQVPPLSSPKNRNDFVYIDDVAKAFELSLTTKFPSGIYNLGTGNMTSVLQCCQIVEKIIHNNNHLSNSLAIQVNQSEADVEFYASTKLTSKQIGWEAKTSILDGINQTIDSMYNL